MTSPAKCFDFFLELIALAIPRPAVSSKDKSGAMYPAKRMKRYERVNVNYKYMNVYKICITFQ
jgi:hypothetical protein